MRNRHSLLVQLTLNFKWNPPSKQKGRGTVDALNIASRQQEETL